MKRNAWQLCVLSLALAVLACDSLGGVDTQTVPASPVVEEAPVTILPLETTITPATDTLVPEWTQPEAIRILAPGPGSRLLSPLRVQGVADPTFEQNLVLRLVLPDGEVLAQANCQIQADAGQRGPFEAVIPFSVSVEQNALLQVLAVSPRDGLVTHLSSTGVFLAVAGAVDIRPGQEEQEAIVILSPQPGEIIQGGQVTVHGYGRASFEGTLVVEVFDAGGNLLGSQPLIVAAPDMGLPGFFEAVVVINIAESGPGLVRVLDPLPIFDGRGHITSVHVVIEP